jgi:crotonyl-CoA reductase
MSELADFLMGAEQSDDPRAAFRAGVAAFPVPETYRAAALHAQDAYMFDGVKPTDRDPRQSVHVEEVSTPDLGPDEALVAVMASAINYNTVWSSIFHPESTFSFLRSYGRQGGAGTRHDLSYHVIGSDASGVVLRTGANVTAWQPGDEVVVHCVSGEMADPAGYNDAMLDPQQRTWGYETNFGGLAELCLVKANQLLPKPAHLTWEEAASVDLVNSTAYRQLISSNGAGMKLGDTVLIWGAAGGLGSFATQLALAGGGIPICVVSSADKAELCRRLGAELIIDRSDPTLHRGGSVKTDNMFFAKALRDRIRTLTGGEDPRIVFEHTGAETFGASIVVAARGGTIVTCASTSGYTHTYDNRHLWMYLKRIVGTHAANYREAAEANRLVALGRVHPTLSKTVPLQELPASLDDVRHNRHTGKVGVLCCASDEGFGVRDHELRNRVKNRLDIFRSAPAGI